MESTVCFNDTLFFRASKIIENAKIPIIVKIIINTIGKLIFSPNLPFYRKKQR